MPVAATVSVAASTAAVARLPVAAFLSPQSPLLTTHSFKYAHGGDEFFGESWKHGEGRRK